MSQWRAAAGRLGVLLLMSAVAVGGAVAYDAVAAVAPYMARARGIDGGALGALYSAYHLPNLIVVLIGGLVIDSVGAAPAAAGLAAIVFAATAWFAAAPGFAQMVGARVLLGVGNEALSVAQLAMVNGRFAGTASTGAGGIAAFPSIALSYTLTIVAMRTGSVVMFSVLPDAVATHGWAGQWLVAYIAAGSLAAALAMLAVDRWWPPPAAAAAVAAVPVIADEIGGAGDDGDDESAPFLGPRDDLAPLPPPVPVVPPPQPRRGWCAVAGAWARGACAYQGEACASHVWRRGLGLAAGTMLLASAAGLPFGEISTALYADLYHLSDARAARTAVVGTIVAIVLMAPAAALLDARGWYSQLLVTGVAIAIPCRLALLFVAPIPPAVVSGVLGVSAAMFGAAVWPLIALRVPFALQGRVLSLLTAAQNAIMVVSPVVVGALRDRRRAPASATGAAAGSPLHAYTDALIYIVVLEAVCLALAVWLGVTDGWAPPSLPAPLTVPRRRAAGAGAATMAHHLSCTNTATCTGACWESRQQSTSKVD